MLSSGIIIFGDDYIRIIITQNLFFHMSRATSLLTFNPACPQFLNSI